MGRYHMNRPFGFSEATSWESISLSKSTEKPLTIPVGCVGILIETNALTTSEVYIRPNSGGASGLKVHGSGGTDDENTLQIFCDPFDLPDLRAFSASNPTFEVSYFTS